MNSDTTKRFDLHKQTRLRTDRSSNNALSLPRVFLRVRLSISTVKICTEIRALREALRGQVCQVPKAYKSHGLELRALREVLGGQVLQIPKGIVGRLARHCIRQLEFLKSRAAASVKVVQFTQFTVWTCAHCARC